MYIRRIDGDDGKEYERTCALDSIRLVAARAGILKRKGGMMLGTDGEEKYREREYI
jgi:hypothetical protein